MLIYYNKMKSKTIDGITIKESNCLNRGIKIDDIIYVFFKKPTTANYGTNRNNKLDDTNKEQLPGAIRSSSQIT